MFFTSRDTVECWRRKIVQEPEQWSTEWTVFRLTLALAGTVALLLIIIAVNEHRMDTNMWGWGSLATVVLLRFAVLKIVFEIRFDSFQAVEWRFDFTVQKWWFNVHYQAGNNIEWCKQLHNLGWITCKAVSIMNRYATFWFWQSVQECHLMKLRCSFKPGLEVGRSAQFNAPTNSCSNSSRRRFFQPRSATTV